MTINIYIKLASHFREVQNRMKMRKIDSKFIYNAKKRLKIRPKLVIGAQNTSKACVSGSRSTRSPRVGLAAARSSRAWVVCRSSVSRLLLRGAGFSPRAGLKIRLQLARWACSLAAGRKAENASRGKYEEGYFYGMSPLALSYNLSLEVKQGQQGRCLWTQKRSPTFWSGNRHR